MTVCEQSAENSLPAQGRQAALCLTCYPEQAGALAVVQSAKTGAFNVVAVNIRASAAAAIQ
jgi:hypothetical protein